MDTRAVAHDIRLRHWAGMLKEQQESGRSIRAWCRENKVAEKTYYYWQRKLREVACEQMTALQAAGISAPGFAEVRTEPLALSETTTPSRICVETDRIRITTDSTYPPDKLASLIRELSRPC